MFLDFFEFFREHVSEIVLTWEKRLTLTQMMPFFEISLVLGSPTSIDNSDDCAIQILDTRQKRNPQIVSVAKDSWATQITTVPVEFPRSRAAPQICSSRFRGF